MATVNWVILKHHKKRDGTYNPKIRITQNRTSAYISTSIYTPLVRFRRGCSLGSVTDTYIEEVLNDKVKDVRHLLIEYDNLFIDCDTASEVVSMIRKIQSFKRADIDFIEFSKDYIKKNIKKESTRTNRYATINSLSLFIRDEYNTNRLPIKNINLSFLNRYESWLKSSHQTKEGNKQKGLKASSVRIYMCNIQTLFNKAKLHYNDYELNNIVIKNDPFIAYKIPDQGVFRKRSIPVSDLKKIIDADLKNRYEMISRDVFVLSFMLAGMNLIDMFNLPPFDDKITYNRTKTGERKRGGSYISIDILPEMEKIINKYKDKRQIRGFCFYEKYSGMPSFSMSINRGLKKLCKSLSINEFTYYSARHTFATIARNDCGYSMEDVAFCLTHASEYKMTDVYVSHDYAKVNEVIKSVIQYVMKK